MPVIEVKEKSGILRDESSLKGVMADKEGLTRGHCVSLLKSLIKGLLGEKEGKGRQTLP